MFFIYSFANFFLKLLYSFLFGWCMCFLHVCLYITNMPVVPAQMKTSEFSELELEMSVTCHMCGK